MGTRSGKLEISGLQLGTWKPKEVDPLTGSDHATGEGKTQTTRPVPVVTN